MDNIYKTIDKTMDKTIMEFNNYCQNYDNLNEIAINSKVGKYPEPTKKIDSKKIETKQIEYNYFAYNNKE